MKLIFYPGFEFFDNQNDNDDKYVYSNLTIGKEYKCIRNDDDIYVVINDTGNECIYLKKYFLTIEEYRNKKLGEIGI